MSEQWRAVPSVPEIKVSSLGRVLMPERKAEMPNGGVRTYKTRPRLGTKTTASKGARHVYYAVQSRHFGNLKVHRLVCEAFHGPPPFEGAVVIHLDENALNNEAKNLKWGTQRENLNMPGFLEYCRCRTGENSPAAKGKAKRASQTRKDLLRRVDG